ncbi:hypothetical protein BCR44DRAFT_334218 [Catenaria anguillulae PL171]|uniref:SPRY domain-containing protein n=1 Tax=Catenaria anguillulae PL171 TaxID=765915 RepID=A0A1Y2HC46_9FUNG|nr:hypothetical protein BCR44DRAFT_334218 [Catenaria anguillulae PL171]
MVLSVNGAGPWTFTQTIPDAFARKLLSSLKLGKLISTPDAASNLENIGKIQSALVCANVQTIPTIQKLLREMPFIQLAYDNVHDAHTMPVALRFLLTFDPDARSKLLDLFVKQSDALAAELTSSTEGIDSDSLRAFMYSVYCLLAETSARDTRFTRQRLIKNGKLLDILRFASSEPSVRFYPATYQLAGALCEDESLVPMIVDAFHRPLLAHLHPSMNDLVSAIEVVLDSVRGQPATSIDNAAVDAAGQLYFSTVSWFHHSFSHALKPPVVATLVELPDVGLSQILDCLKQLLNMNILDSEKHPFAHRNRPKALDLYFNRNQHCIKSGWSTRWHEFDAYVAFTESCALLPSVMRSVCLVLSELADFDVTRPQCLEILPTVPALLFSTSSSNDSFFRNLLQAPSDVFDHYYEWIAAHYSTVVQLDCSSFANKSNLLLVEALERSCIRSPTVDAVHWASMTGNVQTSVRGTMVFNFSQHQQQLRGSHGVTGKGKYCFTVFSPDESGIICGWTTYTGPLAWNKCLFKHAQDEGELQTVVVDYDDICAWNTGKYRNTIMTPVPNSVVTCVLDLDAGVFTAALNDMPFHVIFDNLDCSQTWYPVLFPQADTVVDTDFNDTMREVSGIPLGLAPACDLTRHPDARLPQPAADQPAAAVHDYAPIASNDAPVLDSEQVAELTIHNYYEAKLTPSQTNHVLAAGFRMDNFYTLWIGTHQIELAVQFFLQDDGPVEDSVPWRKWIPVVVDHLLQNDEATMPDRFGVKFTPENDAVANVIELSSSAISEIQLNVCGYCVREGCAGFLFKDLDPICSSPINLGVAIVADKSGSRSFAVTKGLDTAFASDMFPWAFVGQSHVMTPLLIHARSVTLNMHSDLEAPESWALVGPLIQGRKREDLQTWFENCKA